MISRAKAHQLRAMIEKASVSLSDGDALEAVELFPAWQADHVYTRKNDEEIRVRDPEDGLLYKLNPDIREHHSQSDWPPRLVPAIWQKVAKPGQGDTPDNPIPWSWGLKIYNGKYYSQNDVLYRGIRDSGVGIWADLSALVHDYVEIYTP